jgi:uncharacterized protein
MAKDEAPVPESLLPYDHWIQEASRQVVVSAVALAAREGLPGGHHFYITFKTAYPGVIIPDRLRAQYPDEMTIVLQHQFHSLVVDEHTQVISVGLSFSGIPSVLVIPVTAITAFADPEVRFGLSFDVDIPERIDLAEFPVPDGDDAPAQRAAAPAEIVSLDAFRRRGGPKD